MTYRLLHIVIWLVLSLGLGFNAMGQDQVLVNQYTLTSEGADVLVSWQLQSEEGVKEYRLFRRINEEPTAAHVVTLPATGSPVYTFLDDAIFKTESRVIYYELHVVTQSRVHKFSRSLSHNPTSVQRTWGSIKAMFRY